jgi:arylsulfatase A-like enzyme
MADDMKNPVKLTRQWMIIFVLSVFAIYFYIVMEWLFFVTKQSFMSSLGLAERLRVLWVTPAPFVILVAAVLFVLLLPAMITKNLVARKICLGIGLLVPSVTLALAAFLLVDNFTYTVLGFGVKSTLGYQGLVYGFLVLALVWFVYQFMVDAHKRLSSSGAYRKFAYVALGLFAVSLIFAAVGRDEDIPASLLGGVDATTIQKRPNVIILASDGLNAENMSAYGYERDTTPFISQLAENALFCENCFPNAGTSGGSIASMFTGRLPTQTRLVYPPDILRGADRYRHLPGIFKELGYRNIDISIKHYADPYDLNMQRSFDFANFREFREMNETASGLSRALTGQDAAYFIFVMNDRITSRLLHAFSIRSMDDAYLMVTEGDRKQFVKYEKGVGKFSSIVSMFSFIDASPDPFFAHMHLLKTHGPRFDIERPVFSRGKEQTEEWMTDFYDDAILSFDGQVREIVRGLVKRGLMNETIIVICTDHGEGFTVDKRIPLIFLFPGGEHRGRIGANAQNLDIGPTLLDYMGIERPDWMEGLSLLRDDVEARQFIFTVDRVHGKEIGDMGHLQLDMSAISPPFYTLGSVGVFYCNRLFNLILEKNALEISTIEGHTSPCKEEDLPAPEMIRKLIIDHLEEHGYDISSLEQSRSISPQ